MVNYREIFIILAFILITIVATAKLSPSSYAISINNNQINGGLQQDKVKQIVDNNAFSNLSRNLTSFTESGRLSFAGNVTSTTSSIGQNLGTGDRNSNSPNSVVGVGSRSSSTITHHGSPNNHAHLHSSGSSSSSINSTK